MVSIWPMFLSLLWLYSIGYYSRSLFIRIESNPQLYITVEEAVSTNIPCFANKFDLVSDQKFANKNPSIPISTANTSDQSKVLQTLDSVFNEDLVFLNIIFSSADKSMTCFKREQESVYMHCSKSSFLRHLILARKNHFFENPVKKVQTQLNFISIHFFHCL